tara:strand:+ start:4753 stop:5679 length:927 start_codon:yes stop_codon:yes gene_type:complete
MKNNKKDFIAVCSRSFSANPLLRKKILSKYKNVKFNDRGIKLEGSSLHSFVKGASKIIVGLEKIDKQLLASLPELKLISKYGVGIDNIDTHAMKKYNKKLINYEGVNKRSISELILLLILNSMRKIKLINSDITLGKWKQRVGSELSGKTVGIIGFGNIGQDLSVILRPFECKIIFYDISINHVKKNILRKVKRVSLNKLLTSADIITLNLPYNRYTKNIIDKNNIKLMKSNSILINTARGGLVDEKALFRVLKQKKIAAAAFDVFEKEPPQNSNLLKLDNFFATSHIGSITNEAIIRMGMAAIKGLQ